jgi:hypothetical protein
MFTVHSQKIILKVLTRGVLHAIYKSELLYIIVTVIITVLEFLSKFIDKNGVIMYNGLKFTHKDF